MPDTTAKPVIFLAFANNRADPAHFLDKLAEEERRLRETLGGAAELCDVVYDETATADEILALFQRHRDRIAIFHFAGHANSYQLLLETADGQPAAANAGGFAAFLGQQTGLELVFLNGCSTQGQVEELLAAKVPAVIATDQKIKDDIATDFAALFYGGLATGVSIRSAFEQAKAGIRFKKGDKTRDLFEEDVAEATPASAIPWDLHALPDYDPAAWTLWEAAGNPLFGLPPLSEQPLSPSPFPGLAPYTADQAELFFGRGAEIRRLFDWAVSDKTPPILLLHGQTGVGKSSLLAAGLRPRLTARQQVRYLRRDPVLGLTGTLLAALADLAPREKSDGDQPPDLAARWRATKAQSTQALTVILDQADEALTRPATGQVDEYGALAAALAPLFADPAQPSAGKLILACRQEALAPIRQALAAHGLSAQCLEQPVDRLDRAGIMEAVRGPAQNARLRAAYRVTIDDELPTLVAEDLTTDDRSPIAPMLQVLLGEMWAQASKDEPRSLGCSLYNAARQDGYGLRAFLANQLSVLQRAAPDIVDSGWALDLLAEHATSLGAARARSLDELRATYPQHADALPALIQQCQDLYLLTDLRPTPYGDLAGQDHVHRLAHDTLALVVRQRYGESDMPGQRARRILENAVIGADQAVPETKKPTVLSEADLATVEAGERGMRARTEAEERLVTASRQARDRNRRIRRTVIGSFIGLGILIAIVAVFAGWQANVATRAQITAEARRVDAEEQRGIAQAESTRALKAEGEAVVQRDNAVTAQAEAEREAKIALSRQLAAQSATELNQDQSELALLLSIEAGYTAETLEAYDAIRVAIADTHSRILSGETSVEHMVQSPDGTQILITGDDLAKVLNGETLVEWVRLEDPKGLYEPRWNSTGDRILARHGNVVRVWSAQTGELQLNLDHAGAFVEDAVWSRDGNRILSASSGHRGVDLENSGWVWDAQTGKELMRLVGHTSEVNIARWSPDERLILTASHDGVVRVWDANTGLLLTALKDNTSVFPPDRAIWSPKGDRILAYEDKHIWIWDTATQQKQILFDIEQGDLFTVEWRPGNDGQILANDIWNRAYVVDSDQGKPLFTLEDISTAVWSQDGSRILTAGPDQSAVVWNADTGQEIKRLQHSAEVREATWANDDRQILTTDVDGVARVWDMKSTGHEINPLQMQSSPAVTWSNNGGEIYLSANDSVGVWNPDKDEFSWGSEQAKIRQRLEKIPGIIYIGKQYAFTGVVIDTDTTNAFTLAILDANTASELIRIPAVFDFKESPDESYVLARHTTGIGTIYDVASGEQVSNLEEPLEDSWNPIWSADNQTILVVQPKVGRRPIVSLFDVSTGRRISAGLEENLPGGEFILHDERVAVISEKEKDVSIWNARNGANLLTLKRVRFASWAKDGKRILVIGDDKTASIWDVERKTQLTKMIGNSGDINQATWSADEKRVLTSSADNTVRLWDATTGQTLMRLENVNSPEWSRDNRLILTKSKNGITTTLQVFYSVMDGLVSKTCQKAPRNMIWDEWNRFMNGPYRPTCPEAFITPDVIKAIQSQAKTEVEAGDLVMARAILARLNGWLVESGQLKSYGADPEALFAEGQKMLVPDTSPQGTPEGNTP